jgi:hypothetical protein
VSSGQKLILGLLATITLKVVPFHAYSPFPALLPFFKCILESWSVRVFGTACNSASSCVKMAASQFCLQQGKQRKVGGGLQSYCFLVKSSLVKKEVQDGVVL